MSLQRITGSGYCIPESVVTNEELVSSFNEYVDKTSHHGEKAKKRSNVEFIERASGITQRHVVDKQGVLDVERMRPYIEPRGNDEISFQAEFALASCYEAIENAGLTPDDIDAVIVSCSIVQRAYPGIAIEIKKALGIESGWAFDMTAGCSSAIFGISMAVSSLKQGLANKILVVTPELYSCHSNFRDRRSHFIFGDGSSALVIENVEEKGGKEGYDVVSIDLLSQFSNNIRNNTGFLNHCEDDSMVTDDKLFSQIGKNVRLEVVPITVEHLNNHCDKQAFAKEDIKKLWLHQANSHINNNIARQFFARDVTQDDSPIHLDHIANTGASGVIISFHNSHNTLSDGEHAMLCAFGAGYSLGSVIVKKQQGELGVAEHE